MCELLLTEMISLINSDVEKRTLPAVCAALDGIRARRPLLKAPSSKVDQAVSSAVAHALAAAKAAKK